MCESASHIVWTISPLGLKKNQSRSAEQPQLFLNVELIIGQSFNNGPCAWIYVTFNLKPARDRP